MEIVPSADYLVCGEIGWEGGGTNQPTHFKGHTSLKILFQLESESDEELERNFVLRRSTKFPFLLLPDWDVLFEMLIVHRLIFLFVQKGSQFCNFREVNMRICAQKTFTRLETYC